MSLLNLFLIILFSVSFYNGLFLVINKSHSTYKNAYLGVTIMIYSLFFLSYVWWYQEKFILQAPFLMRTVNPLMFLSMPFFYFFVRNTLSGETHLRKTDFIHFLPALIHFLELLPFYFMPYEEKYQLALRTVAHPEKLDVLIQSIIPGVWLNAARMVLQFIYCFMSIHLLFRKEVKAIWGTEAISIRNWLLVSVVLISFLLFSHLLYYISNLLIASNVLLPKYVAALNYILIITPMVLLNIYLRINQHLVYGYTLQQVIEEKKQQNKVVNSVSMSLQEAAKATWAANIDLAALSKQLDVLMREKKVYLNKALDLYALAEDAGVNTRVLSQFINIKHNKGVRDYINQFRVMEAIELMKSGYLENKSLEGLCHSVGFNSRVTFFLAFKKHTGMSPTEYLKQTI